jgi:hypothetical protein
MKFNIIQFTLISIILILIKCSSLQNNNTETNKIGFIGYWSEKDTSVASEYWEFTDSIANNGYKHIDTIAKCYSWYFHSDTIYLTDFQNNHFKVAYLFKDKYNLDLYYNNQWRYFNQK